jgi:hypothetical protein
VTRADAEEEETSMAKDAELHACVPRIVPFRYQASAAARAVGEHADNRIMMSPQASSVIGKSAGPGLSLAIVVKKKWANGRTLRCRFLDGSPTQRKKVEAKAHLWEPHCNIKLKFGSDPNAEIRISFQADPGSWSGVGTDALVEEYFPKYQPTMNFGWLKANTDDQEYERVVVHEFGHALGAIHEHQSPKAKLKWNKEVVYRYFQGPPNYWSKADVDHNVFDRYKKKEINATTFDADSIMLYYFPGEFFVNGQATNENTHLSAGDKAFIRKMYPK